MISNFKKKCLAFLSLFTLYLLKQLDLFLKDFTPNI